MQQLQPDEISVSVIVPAFNMELFIEQCLRSLFDQTLDSLEVIVVDDGSTDRTRAIVESLTPPAGKSLRLISKPNAGLSSARNAGMKAAQGHWIGFVDADDWVASTMYSVLTAEAESAGAELAIATGVDVDSASRVQRPSADIELWNAFIASHGRHVNPRDCPDLFVLDHSPCRRVYRRTFLERIGFAFVDGVIYEDAIANYQLLFRTNSAVLIDEPMYFYRVGREGQITDRRDHTNLDILPVMNMVVDELWHHSASVELWANFIHFQGWNMLWHCYRITYEHKKRLASGAMRIALKFPPRGLTRFRQKFGNDARITTGVDLQLFGDADLFVEYSGTLVASERAKKVASSAILARFFTARAQVTSRLARMSSLRRFRQIGPDLNARSVAGG
jgi:glycosyltransferase involved in cell wall biosynthesis